MFGIFETSTARKSRAFNNVEFASLDDAEAWVRKELSHILVLFERDEDNEAADFCTKIGMIFQVERI